MRTVIFDNEAVQSLAPSDGPLEIIVLRHQLTVLRSQIDRLRDEPPPEARW